MSLHRRRVIRQAVVQGLIDAATAAGSRVFDHAWNVRDTLPAIVVEDLSEDQQTPTFGAGAARHLERRLLLQVSAELDSLGNPAADRDDLLAEIEVAVAGLQLPGVQAIVPAGYDSDEAMNGGRPLVVGRQRFEVTYLTPMNNPAVAL